MVIVWVAKYICSLPQELQTQSVVKSSFVCSHEAGKMPCFTYLFHVEADIGVVVVNLPQ